MAAKKEMTLKPVIVGPVWPGFMSATKAQRSMGFGDGVKAAKVKLANGES